jgi:hypothetical protein
MCANCSAWHTLSDYELPGKLPTIAPYFYQ